MCQAFHGGESFIGRKDRQTSEWGIHTAYLYTKNRLTSFVAKRDAELTRAALKMEDDSGVLTHHSRRRASFRQIYGTTIQSNSDLKINSVGNFHVPSVDSFNHNAFNYSVIKV